MFRTLNTTALWTVTLAAAGILMVSMGARQSIGLFLAPLNASTGLGIASISLAMAIGQFACDRPQVTVVLGTERAPVGQRRGRRSAGRAPRGVGLEVARLDPARPQGGIPRPVRDGERRDGIDGGAPPLDLARQLPRLLDRLADHPPAIGGPDRDQGSFGCGVVREPAAPLGDRRCDGLGGTPFDRRSSRRGIEVPLGRGLVQLVPGLDDGLPPGAAAQVRLQRPLHGTVIADRCPLGPQGGEAHDDARRAETALAAARGTQGGRPVGPHLGIEPVDGRDGASGDPADRGHARHARRPVDQDGAAPALPLRAAAVLHRRDPELVAQGTEQRPAAVLDHDLHAIDRQLHLAGGGNGRFGHSGDLRATARVGHPPADLGT